MTPLLEARGLSKRFGGLKAVDDLSLTIEEGELHCLIGPNGAGKSTFFKLVLGRYAPTSGSVRFRGEDITAPASGSPGAGRWLSQITNGSDSPARAESSCISWNKYSNKAVPIPCLRYCSSTPR